MGAELTPRVVAWRDRGRAVTVGGREIHLFAQDGIDPVLLMLHGFPSSSYDWRLVCERLPERAILAPDFLGFGFSEKPPDHDYSLLWQADMVEEVVRLEASGRSVFVLAHDMGTSVATELMARELDGELSFPVAGVLLLNGSMVQGAASPTLAQRLLRGPLGPLAARLSSRRFFRAQFGSIFSPEHPLSAEEAEDQWALVSHRRGVRIGHRTIGYMDERERRAERWHGALREWPGELSIAWGMLDPVATPRVLEAVTALRPRAPVTEWPSLGHYPQIEDPVRVVEALRAGLGTPL